MSNLDSTSVEPNSVHPETGARFEVAKEQEVNPDAISEESLDHPESEGSREPAIENLVDNEAAPNEEGTIGQ